MRITRVVSRFNPAPVGEWAPAWASDSTPHGMSASKYRGAGALGYNGDGMMRLSLRKHGKQKDVNKSLKIALVCSDCLLVSFQPLLVHLSKSADGTFAFDPIRPTFWSSASSACSPCASSCTRPINRHRRPKRSGRCLG